MSASRQISPMGSAGWTSPELVGIQLRASSVGRRRRINSRTACGSIPPSGASGARTTSTPTRRASARYMIWFGVIRAAGEDQVAAAEVERRECLSKGDGGVLLHRHVAFGGPDQATDGLIRVAERVHLRV